MIYLLFWWFLSPGYTIRFCLRSIVMTVTQVVHSPSREHCGFAAIRSALSYGGTLNALISDVSSSELQELKTGTEKMLFKSFIISLLTYSLPVLYTHVFARDKKWVKKTFQGSKEAWSRCWQLRHTKSLAMPYIHDDEHFVNAFLDKFPSGRHCTLKHSVAPGKDCILRHLIHTLNDTLFSFFSDCQCLSFYYSSFLLMPIFFFATEWSGSSSVNTKISQQSMLVKEMTSIDQFSWFFLPAIGNKLLCLEFRYINYLDILAFTTLPQLRPSIAVSSCPKPVFW